MPDTGGSVLEMGMQSMKSMHDIKSMKTYNLVVLSKYIEYGVIGGQEVKRRKGEKKLANKYGKRGEKNLLAALIQMIIRYLLCFEWTVCQVNESHVTVDFRIFSLD